MAFGHIQAWRQYNSVIVTVGDGIDNTFRAVLKDEAIPVIVQPITNAAIVYEDYGAIKVREAGVKVLRGGDHRESLCGQGQRGDWVAAIVIANAPAFKLNGLIGAVKKLHPFE